MRNTRMLIGLLTLALALAPVALAQDAGGDTGTNTGGDTGGGGDTTNIDVNNPPDNVDVDVTDNDGADPDESVGFFGLSGTALIVLVVLAIIVVALIVALASRDRYP